jgi:asparagine synthase (glutamine-hydrolysing)
MCGIYACFFKDGVQKPCINHTVLVNRGPDQYKEYKDEKCFMAFYRLAIVGGSNGMQPYSALNCILICNGEIYNYKELAEKYCYSEKDELLSDCYIIIHLYRTLGIERTVSLLDGEFAFVLYDMTANIIHAARDITGVKPLYYSNKESLEFSSKIKALNNIKDVQHIEPRMIYTYDLSNNTMSKQSYHAFMYKPDPSIQLSHIFYLFKNAVEKRICQSNRPIGFLLSGGFDSSLVLSVALESKLLKTPPDVFTFGFNKNAPDVISATAMVEWLRVKYGNDCINWHLVIENPTVGISNIENTIRALETYDTTTIRASVPMWLISQYIVKNTNVRVLLSGEGSDELFGGYLYFMYSPNIYAARAEVIKLLNNLHYYDNLRADRTTADNGLEVRPPFLDKQFITAILTHPDLCMNVKNTKELIRQATPVGMLPESIHFGKKEAFSDAVGLNGKILYSAIAKNSALTLYMIRILYLLLMK